MEVYYETENFKVLIARHRVLKMWKIKLVDAMMNNNWIK